MRRFSKWFTRRNAVNTPSRWLRLETLEQRDVPAAFTAGNLAVYRIGDGSGTLTSGATAVFIDEYTPTGTLVQSIAMPSTGSSGRFVDSGTATSSGLLTRSSDGRFLVATAYDAALATSSVASAAGVDRIIGRIDSSGTIDVSTKIPQSDGYLTNNIRSAASVDGSAYWTSGAGGSSTGGVRYISHGSTGGSVQISTTSTNTRTLGIFNGQLYVTSASVTIGLNTVGSGLPTTSGQTISTISPTNSAGNAYGFVMLDRDAGVPGLDTIYIADQAAGVLKYSFDGSAWSARGSISGVYTGLVANINGSNVDLYMTSKTTANNDLVKHTDTAAFNATITAGTPTVLATVGANKVWRGMAFTPEAADTTDPTVSTVTSSKPNGAYTIGEQIDVLVQFSENVNVTGTPQLTLETGGTDRVVDFLDGSGTNTLRFRYTVQAGDTSLDLDYFDANSLVLNGGTIEDASGNEAILTLPNPGATGSLGANKAIVIDTTAPAVTGVTSSASGGYNIGDTISITVNFTEIVSVSGSPRLLLETGTTDREAVYVSGSGSNTLTFTYTVQAGDESLDLDYVATDSLGLNGGTIQDAALNDASLTLAAPGAANSLGANASIVVDGVVPDLVEFAFPGGTITNASTLVYDLEFTEDITGLDITDFNIVTTGSLSATITAILYSGTPGVYTVEVEAIGDGDLTLELLDDGTIVDTVGNLFRGDLNTTVSAPTVTVDQTVPTVLVSRGDPNPTNANEVDFIVDFSEAHTGFTLDDLEIVTTLSLTFISNFNQTSPTSYTITVNTGTGTGTLQLNFLDDDTVIDAAGNPIDGPGSATISGPVYDVDRTPPLVDSVAVVGSNPTNASSVDFLVTFTEPVSQLSAANFALTQSGGLGATITNVDHVAGSNIAIVTVNTGSGSGTIRLDFLDDDTITDLAGNLYGGAGTQDFTTGETLEVDVLVPTVVSFVSTASNPTNASVVTFEIVFSETVFGVGGSDFILNETGVTGATITGFSGSGDSYILIVNTGSGSGTISLELVDDDSIVDLAGNPLGGIGGNNVQSDPLTVDRTPPTISGITLDPNPTNAAVVPFYITFTEAVTGVDETDFTLDFTGLTGPFIGSVTGGGANWIVYVNSGSGAGTLAIDLVDDDSIVDAVGNPLAGGASSPAYQIDKVAPTILSIVRDDASPTNASQVGYTVTFSESVFNVDASDFQVNASYGGPGVASVNGASGSSVYTVFVNTAIGEGTLDLELLNDGSITDFASNVLGNSLVGQTYDVDTLGPTILSVVAADTNPTNAQLVNYEVTFSEDVLNLTLADFGLTTTGVGGAFLFGFSGTGTVRTVTVNTGSGSGTIRLDFLDTDAVTDAIGNPFGGAGTQDFTGGDVYTIDRAAPSVVSISLDDPSPTNASSVSFTVTFDEAVTSVDSTDFNLVTFGVSGAGITNVAGLGTTWTVTVNTGTGDGSIRLDLENDGSIVDASNNPLAGGAFAGDEYVIDKTAPTVVVSQASGQADPTTTQPILFTVVFSEPVIGFGATNLTLSGTAGLGSVSISTNNPSADGRTFDVEISNITSDGTITVSVGAGEVTDEAGNLNQADVSTDATVRYDANAPTVNNILPDGPPETNATSVSFNVIFSEEVNGLDLDSAGGFDNFTLVSSGLVGSEITSIAPTSNPNIYLVTVLTGTGDGTLRLDLTSAGAIVDLGNNPLVGTPHEGDALFYIDRTSPVMTFTAVSPNPRQTAVDAVEINFDSSDFVNGLTLSDFSLTRDGAPVSLSSATFNDFFIGYYFTIDGLGTITAADGEYVLTFNSGTSVAADAAGNPIAGDASVTFVVDTVAPTATVTEPTSGPTNAASLFFTVTFSEPVDGLDLDPTGGYDNFNLVTTGTLAGSSIANVSATADPSVFIVEVTTGSGVGTVRLDLENTPPLADLAGNPIAGLPASSGTVAVDTIAPVATIDDGDADDLVQGGATLTYTIDVTDANVGTFLLAAEDVVNAGTSSVSIGSITSAPIAGGIRYTVPVTANTDGTVVLRIANTATFTDAAANALSLPFDDNDTVTVDATRPSVTVNPAPGQAAFTNAQPFVFQVEFSEPIFGFDAAEAVLSGTAGGIVGASKLVTNPSLDNRTFLVTVSGITSDGTVELNVAADVAADAAGNLNTASTGSNVITLDIAAPMAVSVLRSNPATASTNAASVIYAVNFSEAVTGVNASDFTLTTTGVLGANIGSVSGSGSSWFVTVNTGTGEGTIRLNLIDDDSIRDLATNPLAGGLTGETYTVDRTLPTVANITRLDPTTTNLASVRFRITFSEAVQVSTVDPADFTPVGSGVSFTGVSVAQVNSGSTDTQFTVTVSGITGNGTLRLDVSGGTATIQDVAGNALGVSFSGPTYTIDTQGPTVTVNQAGSQGDPTRTQPIRFAIVFSEPVAGFNSSMITRSGTAGGLGGATLVVTNPSSDNRTFEVTVSALTGDGTITLAVPAGVVSDAAGNANAASSFTDSTVTLDTTPPAVSTPDLDPASDSGSSSTDNITNDTTPTFTGTAEAGASITLLFGSTVLGTATATGGTWTITPAALADGVYNVFARATDAAGNITESTFVPVTIDTVGPTSAVTRAPGQAASVTATSPALTAQFTVTFNQPIAGLNASDLTIGGTAGAAITNVAGSGASYTVTVGNLTQPGTITLGVNAGVGTDVAGNAGAASPPGEQVSVTFATQTQVQVTPTGIETGGDATVTATVNAPAGTTPGGSVLFAFNGPGGPINRTINLAAGSASTVFTGLAAGAYSVTATYQPATGYVTSSDSENFTVADPFVPGDQNNIGIYAGVAGQTVTVYNAAGTVVRTFAPFTAAEAPGGVRVAVADLDGDGTPDIAAVTGPGSPAALRVFNGATNAEMYRKNLFVDLQGNPFLSGAFVAAGDLTGDGKADLAVTPDQGGGPRVLVFNGPNGTELRSFLAIDDPNFRGGARTTIGDLNGDGVNDIVASAGFGGGPRIAGFDGAELFTTGRRLFNDFFLFEETLRNGAYVTIGDLNGDGFGDLIGGGGPGGGPRVLAIDGKALAQNGDFTPIANFFAGSDALRGGVRVVAKDMDGDGKSEVVTGSGNTGDLFVFFGDELLAGGSAPARSVALAGVLDGVYVG